MQSKDEISRIGRGAARKAHFANGGDLRAWRGRAATYQDRKAKEDRRACRGPVKD